MCAAVTLERVGRRHVLRCGDAQTPLTPVEARLVEALLAAGGRVLDRASLVTTGWSPAARVNANTLHAYAARIRRRLAAVGAQCRLVTIYRVGYRLDHPESEPTAAAVAG